MILVVDDDKNIRLSLKLILERNGYDVALAEGPKEAIRIVRNTPAVELVLMDMNYNMSTDGEEGLTLLKQVKVFRPDVPCILMTAWGSIDLAVQGLRAGAFDFITKPWDNGVLVERVETAINVAPSKSPRGGTCVSIGIPEDMVAPPRGGREGASPQGGREGAGVPLPSLASIYATIARIAPTNAPVLITGESGTGKELIAEAIHRQSRRANGPFVKVNLGGISSSLFESEMFGHKKGSFTDAKEDRVGRFELANGGTIFLDEIGELDLASQVKLLRVLQDQTYEVLGDSRTRRTDVRVVCATNADLRTMVAEHTFREDLFYRINTISLHLPPLRQRPEDIPPLVDHFLRQTCKDNGLPLPTIKPETIAYLQTLPFPGNIRELKNAVERTVLMGEAMALPPSRLPRGGGNISSDGLLGTIASPWGGREGAGASSSTLEDLERAAIATSIEKNAGNLSLVAKELGISRGALYRKIEKHGL